MPDHVKPPQVVKLVKVTAPPYWARWRVHVGGTYQGRVERPGGFAAWRAYDRYGESICTLLRTRADAVAAVVAHAADA